ncbi:DAR GTPase 2, mitochondrial [Panicum miliaceum]|uniref:DAR GTPase 2, mitochondrial n=1 Tax=Panicum miliaceum TaxID=4540 RepID=A0A3L6QBF3_PANMI|nr:DAR GTPase 2, mitochondrial [Panicum miliaceum]
MDTAERAIRARLTLVDLVLEVHDTRLPASSAFEPLRRRVPLKPDGRRVVVLNKADMADLYETGVNQAQPCAAHWGNLTAGSEFWCTSGRQGGAAARPEAVRTRGEGGATGGRASGEAERRRQLPWRGTAWRRSRGRIAGARREKKFFGGGVCVGGCGG